MAISSAAKRPPLFSWGSWRKPKSGFDEKGYPEKKCFPIKPREVSALEVLAGRGARAFGFSK